MWQSTSTSFLKHISTSTAKNKMRPPAINPPYRALRKHCSRPQIGDLQLRRSVVPVFFFDEVPQFVMHRDEASCSDLVPLDEIFYRYDQRVEVIHARGLDDPVNSRRHVIRPEFIREVLLAQRVTPHPNAGVLGFCEFAISSSLLNTKLSDPLKQNLR